MNKGKVKIILIGFLIIIMSQLNQAFALDNTTTVKNEVKPVQPGIIFSLTNYIKSYNNPYSNVFIATLAVLSNPVAVTSFDSSKGEIKARLKNGKELFILVASFQNNLTKVRITPADGIYDISLETVNKIFDDIKFELTQRK